MLALDCRSDGSKSKDTLGELSVKCIRILHSTDIYEAINLIPMNILRRYWGDLKNSLGALKVVVGGPITPALELGWPRDVYRAKQFSVAKSKK